MADVPFFDIGSGIAPHRDEIHAILEDVLDGGYFVGGAPVSRLEDEFARFIGSSECVGVGNGLDALRIGMEALGIGEGDEVIVPGFTFYATWLAVVQTGATPVPVDVGLHNASLDLAAVEEAITSATKAILVVHLYGIPAALGELRQIADDAGVALIEDAAQSHGARSGDQMTGSVGDFAAFSFYPTKNLGALGDGGAVTTSSRELARVVRSRRSYGQGETKYDHADTGWNSRLDTLQAAFLLSSLPRLNEQNERRREIAGRYLEALGPASSARVIGASSHAESVWHHFVLRSADRTAAREYFAARGVKTDIHYPYFFDTVAPMQAYAGRSDLATSRLLSTQVLSFPIAPWLTEAQVTQVCDALSALPGHLVAE
ncbi:MAG TPA: DegT/DnrJ/EryC1/StrS family aminotransferase [Pseudolysinimonas sp.]|nr:DegT/DnrJ/EryC1/StrS family aminotransferase [Pseudolysinimonas sp.]